MKCLYCDQPARPIINATYRSFTHCIEGDRVEGLFHNACWDFMTAMRVDLCYDEGSPYPKDLEDDGLELARTKHPKAYEFITASRKDQRND